MEVLYAIKKRRSVRKYLDRPVEWDKLMDVLDAARLAPSAGNLQNWKFVVVSSKETKEEIAKAAVDQLWIAHAPVLIVMCAEPKHAESLYGDRSAKLYNIQNCAAAAENILLAATALGLGTCWIGAFSEEKVKDILAMPEDVRVQSIIAVGYADEEPHEPDKLDLEYLVYFERWKNTLHDFAAVTGEYGMKIRTAFENTKELMSKWLRIAKDKTVHESAKLKEKIKKAKEKPSSE